MEAHHRQSAKGPGCFVVVPRKHYTRHLLGVCKWRGQLLSALLKSTWRLLPVCRFHSRSISPALRHHRRPRGGTLVRAPLYIPWLTRPSVKTADLLRRLTRCLCPVIREHFGSSIQTFHNNLPWCFIHQMRLLMKKSVTGFCSFQYISRQAAMYWPMPPRLA